jgi:hypothetical protein
MKLNTVAFGLTAGLIWGGALLVVTIAHTITPAYGLAFLEVIASVYPGYDVGTGAGAIIVGTLYGFVDGTIGGLIFAWLYNLLAGKFTTA